MGVPTKYRKRTVLDKLNLMAFVEELDPVPDPVGCCERLSDLPFLMFLDSALAGSRLGRYSFVAADPVAVVRSAGEHVESVDRVSGTRETKADLLDAVTSLVEPHATRPVPGLPPFQGGAAGYLAYNWGRTLERLPPARFNDISIPEAAFGVYDWVLAWDHAIGRAWLISTGMPKPPGPARDRQAARRAASVRERLRSNRPQPADPLPGIGSGPVPKSAPSYPVEIAGRRSTVSLRSSFTRSGYLDAVERVRAYILAGDIFQSNLSQRFEVPLVEAPWALYRRLRARNAAPFAAYLAYPEGAVLSASPERFLSVDVAGHVETRPIKGTRPRGIGPEHDAALGLALTESAKDRAENLMIVDLMRNDLSRVCLPGSVRVSELFALEHYATVHHLVSTVVGDLAPGVTALDLLRAAFPGSSITGAPQVRAMEIIAELEPSERSVYCGSIGYWSVTGALDTSVAIRTAVAAGGRLCFSAGGGIVADSDPQEEYQETVDKVRGIIEALGAST